jgi:hypothetical protein
MTDRPTHTTLSCGTCGGTVHVGVDHCSACKPDMTPKPTLAIDSDGLLLIRLPGGDIGFRYTGDAREGWRDIVAAWDAVAAINKALER